MTGYGSLPFSGNLLFSLLLFGIALRLGRQVMESRFETTVAALSTRATANLSSATAELAGIGRRVEGLERQVTALAERVHRCEQELDRLTMTVAGGEDKEGKRWVPSP